jgi:hypothetical protein
MKTFEYFAPKNELFDKIKRFFGEAVANEFFDLAKDDAENYFSVLENGNVGIWSEKLHEIAEKHKKKNTGSKKSRSTSSDDLDRFMAAYSNIIANFHLNS